LESLVVRNDDEEGSSSCASSKKKRKPIYQEEKGEEEETQTLQQLQHNDNGKEDGILELILCQHAFHRCCLQSWAEHSDECPICRQTMWTHQIYEEAYRRAILFAPPPSYDDDRHDDNDDNNHDNGRVVTDNYNPNFHPSAFLHSFSGEDSLSSASDATFDWWVQQTRPYYGGRPQTLSNILPLTSAETVADSAVMSDTDGEGNIGRRHNSSASVSGQTNNRSVLEHDTETVPASVVETIVTSTSDVPLTTPALTNEQMVLRRTELNDPGSHTASQGTPTTRSEEHERDERRRRQQDRRNALRPEEIPNPEDYGGYFIGC